MSEKVGETFSQNGLNFGQILTHIYVYVSLQLLDCEISNNSSEKNVETFCVTNLTWKAKKIELYGIKI